MCGVKKIYFNLAILIKQEEKQKEYRNLEIFETSTCVMYLKVKEKFNEREKEHK